MEEHGKYDVSEFDDELARAPGNHAVGTALQFENDHVRVWEIRLEPGERGAFHIHDQTYFGPWSIPAGACSALPTAPSSSVLNDIGWDTVVLERSASPLEGRGAGIVLHPSTARYLLDHGAADLTEISAPVDWLRYVGPDATVLSQTACRFRFTSWTTLYRSLLSCLDPGRYHMGTEVGVTHSGRCCALSRNY